MGGAGTGTFALEAASGVYTELQVGSYPFMDADYARNDPPLTFAQSLFALTTVMSTPRPGLAVVHAGLKALALDSGLPLVWNRPELTMPELRTNMGASLPQPTSLRGDGELPPSPGH